MKSKRTRLIKFGVGAFASLRTRLLADVTSESFALLLAKTEEVGGVRVAKVVAVRHPTEEDYVSRSLGHVRLSRSYVFNALLELQERLDVDTLIDVHTHPFAKSGVRFSGVDDADEREFSAFLTDRFEGVHYGSIVLSRSDYQARMWEPGRRGSGAVAATIRTQTSSERWPSSDLADASNTNAEHSAALFDRNARALGVEVLRKLTSGQAVLLIGAGGLGSLIAESLVQLGFSKIILVDPDVLEVSNVTRVAGATYKASLNGMSKVRSLKARLVAINPFADIVRLQCAVEDDVVRHWAAVSDWIIVTTDNHSSRLYTQMLSQTYFTPMISAGVNISVEGDTVTDVSGEVITMRIGDGYCLSCLGRIDSIKIAFESHAEEEVRAQLVERGYVRGAEVHEPAVKTLNAVVSSLACDRLVNTYSERQRHIPILVYEDNEFPAIYEDYASLQRRSLACFSCGIVEPVGPAVSD